MKPLTSKITAKGQTTLPIEVRKSLKPLFDLSKKFTDLGCAIDPISNKTRYTKYRACLPNEVQYNGGVIVYHHGSKTLLEWAKMCILENQAYLGDQEVLSRLVVSPEYPLYKLPQKYNTFYSHISQEKSPTIVHWLSKTGKEALTREIAQLEQFSVFHLLLKEY